MGEIQNAISTAIPPGPTGTRAVRDWAQMFRDPLATYGALSRRYGDAVRIPLSRKHKFFLLSRPEHAEHVLVQHQDRYVKAFTYRPLKAFLGDGLLTAEGSVWQRHEGQEFSPVPVIIDDQDASGGPLAGPLRLFPHGASRRRCFLQEREAHDELAAMAEAPARG